MGKALPATAGGLALSALGNLLQWLREQPEWAKGPAEAGGGECVRALERYHQSAEQQHLFAEQVLGGLSLLLGLVLALKTRPERASGAASPPPQQHGAPSASPEPVLVPEPTPEKARAARQLSAVQLASYQPRRRT